MNDMYVYAACACEFMDDYNLRMITTYTPPHPTQNSSHAHTHAYIHVRAHTHTFWRSRVAPLRSAKQGLASLNMKERERTFIMIKPDAVQRGTSF
jgi:hypothetical protein